MPDRHTYRLEGERDPLVTRIAGAVRDVTAFAMGEIREHVYDGIMQYADELQAAEDGTLPAVMTEKPQGYIVGKTILEANDQNGVFIRESYFTAHFRPFSRVSYRFAYTSNMGEIRGEATNHLHADKNPERVGLMKAIELRREMRKAARQRQLALLTLDC